MASDIRTHLNSKYVQLSNKLRRKQVIQVYVEGLLDKSFWLFFLQPYEKLNNCEFRVSILRDRDKTLCGKDSVLSYKHEEDLGKNLWLCIDSDYDELIKDYGNYSALIRRNKYIITTWWYSIENLKCTPELLRANIIKTSLHDTFDVDLNSIMCEISKLYKKIFFLLLEMEEKHDARFKINDFCICLSKISFRNNKLDTNSIQTEINNWVQKHNNLFTHYGNNINRWEYRLKSLGFCVEDYYQLYNGHGLYEHIAVPMVEYYAKSLRSEQLNRIANGADNEERKKGLVAEYNHRTIYSCGATTLRNRIEQLIADNDPMMESSAALKIKEQIEAAFV